MASFAPAGVGPRNSQIVAPVGATGDLSRRKLLPGLFHLTGAGFIPGYRNIGVSLDDLDAQGQREVLVHSGVSGAMVDYSCSAE
jgi:glucose-6-phosphate 1-dehydrogenase